MFVVVVLVVVSVDFVAMFHLLSGASCESTVNNKSTGSIASLTSGVHGRGGGAAGSVASGRCPSGRHRACGHAGAFARSSSGCRDHRRRTRLRPAPRRRQQTRAASCLHKKVTCYGTTESEVDSPSKLALYATQLRNRTWARQLIM